MSTANTSMAVTDQLDGGRADDIAVVSRRRTRGAQNAARFKMKAQTVRILGFSGSLRRASNSTAVLRGLQDTLAPRAALNVFPLHKVPLYNEDDDGEHAADAVRALRSAIETSDGVIMISPEYNHGMSGVLKNALDWASRPFGRSALRGKPVLTMTASPAFTGGVRAQQQMHETLAAIPARPVLRPQIVIGGVHEKVRDGRLVDEATLRFALAGVDDLLDEIRAARFLRAAA
jgi:chromate reductase